MATNNNEELVSTTDSKTNDIEARLLTYRRALGGGSNEIRRKLLPARSPLFAEHLVSGFLRGDTEQRYAAYQTAINSGWLSRNEAREP